MIALLAVLMAQAEIPPGRDCRPGSIDDCYTEAHYQCVETAQTTAILVGCMGSELDRQDSALNRTYAQTMGRLNVRQQRKLRTAQRAWIAYRDAHCASLVDGDWGGLSRVTAAGCLLDMTIERRLDLQDHSPVSEPG